MNSIRISMGLLPVWLLALLLGLGLSTSAVAQDDDDDWDDEDTGDDDQDTGDDDGGWDDEDSGDDDTGDDDEDTGEEEEAAPKERSSDRDSGRDRGRDVSGSKRGKDADSELAAELERSRKRRVIKVVQKKFFLKYRRLEATPMFALIPSDVFLRRYMFGANIAYHVSEIFSIEFFGAYSPNLGDADKKNTGQYLLDCCSLQASISRVMMVLQLDMGISPIYGKVELGNARIINYDIYVLLGGGIVYTHDDIEIASDAPEHAQHLKQFHPSSNFGVGFRIAFNEWIAARIEGRWTFHVEGVVLEQLALEFKNNFSVHLGASFFLPPKIEN